MHIFLADDDEDDRIIFEEALQEISSAIVLVTAEDGNKLIAKLESAPVLPDLIFLDLNMPNKNGKETLKEIRGNDRYAGVPVIIYSTSTNRMDIDYTLSGGANRYLEKPYSVAHLVKVLEAILTFDWKNSFSPKRDEFLIASKVGVRI